MGPKCGTQRNSTEAEGLLIRNFPVKSLLHSDLEEFLKLTLKESRMMQCKKGKEGKGQLS